VVACTDDHGKRSVLQDKNPGVSARRPATARAASREGSGFEPLKKAAFGLRAVFPAQRRLDLDWAGEIPPGSGNPLIDRSNREMVTLIRNRDACVIASQAMTKCDEGGMPHPSGLGPIPKAIMAGSESILSV